MARLIEKKLSNFISYRNVNGMFFSYRTMTSTYSDGTIIDEYCSIEDIFRRAYSWETPDITIRTLTENEVKLVKMKVE